MLVMLKCIRRISWAFFLMCLSSSLASAGVLKWDMGIAGNLGQYSVDDPEGNTDTSSSYSIAPAFAFVYNRDWRLWAELDYKTFELDYSSDNIGQDVKSISLDLLMQRALNRSNRRFFLNGGIGFAKDTMRDRAILDSEGFIMKEYDDRSEFNSALLLGGGVSWLTKRGSFGANLLYQFPFSDGVMGFKIGFYWLFFSKDNTL